MIAVTVSLLVLLVVVVTLAVMYAMKKRQEQVTTDATIDCLLVENAHLRDTIRNHEFSLEMILDEGQEYGDRLPVADGTPGELA